MKQEFTVNPLAVLTNPNEGAQRENMMNMPKPSLNEELGASGGLPPEPEGLREAIRVRSSHNNAAAPPLSDSPAARFSPIFASPRCLRRSSTRTTTGASSCRSSATMSRSEKVSWRPLLERRPLLEQRFAAPSRRVPPARAVPPRPTPGRRPPCRRRARGCRSRRPPWGRSCHVRGRPHSPD